MDASSTKHRLPLVLSVAATVALVLTACGSTSGAPVTATGVKGGTLIMLGAGDVMVERFHTDPRIRATELLLQERTPRAASIIDPRPAEESHRAAAAPWRAPRRIRSPHRHHPSAQILSNGAYVVFVTNSGSHVLSSRHRVTARSR